MSQIFKFSTPFLYLLAFVYTVYGIYLHSGTEEMIFDTFSREEMYIVMGVGFSILGVISELMGISTEGDDHGGS